jgi:hypothetical protein
MERVLRKFATFEDAEEAGMRLQRDLREFIGL